MPKDACEKDGVQDRKNSVLGDFSVKVVKAKYAKFQGMRARYARVRKSTSDCSRLSFGYFLAVDSVPSAFSALEAEKCSVLILFNADFLTFPSFPPSIL